MTDFEAAGLSHFPVAFFVSREAAELVVEVVLSDLSRLGTVEVQRSMRELDKVYVRLDRIALTSLAMFARSAETMDLRSEALEELRDAWIKRVAGG
jgi:hypothetical protein